MKISKVEGDYITVRESGVSTRYKKGKKLGKGAFGVVKKC